MDKLQILKKHHTSKEDLLYTYYSLISTINRLSLTDMEIKILVFTAIEGNISSKMAVDKAISQLSTSSATISNLTAKLVKKGLLIKEDKKKRVRPLLCPPFSSSLNLNISLSYDTTG